jgi:hypothetical protein
MASTLARMTGLRGATCRNASRRMGACAGTRTRRVFDMLSSRRQPSGRLGRKSERSTVYAHSGLFTFWVSLFRGVALLGVTHRAVGRLTRDCNDLCSNLQLMISELRLTGPRAPRPRRRQRPSTARAAAPPRWLKAPPKGSLHGLCAVARSSLEHVGGQRTARDRSSTMAHFRTAAAWCVIARQTQTV